MRWKAFQTTRLSRGTRPPRLVLPLRVQTTHPATPRTDSSTRATRSGWRGPRAACRARRVRPRRRRNGGRRSAPLPQGVVAAPTHLCQQQLRVRARCAAGCAVLGRRFHNRLNNLRCGELLERQLDWRSGDVWWLHRVLFSRVLLRKGAQRGQRQPLSRHWGRCSFGGSRRQLAATHRGALPNFDMPDTEAGERAFAVASASYVGRIVRTVKA